ncbi:MAG TPA: hypothetical protein VEU96_18535 [Bryobacteraceae bacterium]|nr:hypothetical protein [Bryobacteraceae bacterium]
MTIVLPLDPQEEAKLIAAAHAKGLSADAFVRAALHEILVGSPPPSESRPVRNATGAALVAAMQASPYKEKSLVAGRGGLPVRDVGF